MSKNSVFNQNIMKKKLFIIFLIGLSNLIASPEQTIPSNKNLKALVDTSILERDSLTELIESIEKEEVVVNRTKGLSNEEKQFNFFMRTGLLIFGTFIFLFVLFLVFKIKKK